MTRNATSLHDDADDVEVITLTQLEHVSWAQLISNENEGVVKLFGLQQACCRASPGEHTLNTLKYAGNVFNTVSEIIIVNLLKIASDLFETQ